MLVEHENIGWNEKLKCFLMESWEVNGNDEYGKIYQ